MKLIAQSSAVERLADIRDEFGAEIRGNYEQNAKPCSACVSPGICCRDAHFVNVRITRLEAAAINSALESLGQERRDAIKARVKDTVARYELSGDPTDILKTYACPLFEPAIGCLVHHTAKPLPCIAHACYENKEDLPPDELLTESEKQIQQLNRRVYGRELAALPLPVAIAS